MFYEIKETTTQKHAKFWIPPHEVESGVIDQTRNVLQLDGVVDVCMMPDCHVGKGCSIGSVVVTKNIIIPALVGVDIGCLDKDTEFLSPTGWKKISQWKGEDVLEYDPSTDIASFTQPLAYIKKPESVFFHIHHARGLDQMVCPNHKMLLYNGYDKNQRRYSIEIAKDFISRHRPLSKGAAVGFKTTFKFHGNIGINLNVDILKVHIMVSADGCLRNNGSGYCEIHLRKPRKILRCKELLNNAGIDFKLYEHKDGSKTYKFIPPFFHKKLDIFYQCTRSQLGAITDELWKWDGHCAKDDQLIYYSTIKENADAVQFALAAIGTRTGIHKTQYLNKKWKDCYQVYSTKNKFVNMSSNFANPIKMVNSEDGYSYCFTVPTGFFIARRNNNIFATGNCGMIAVRTSLEGKKIQKKLQKIHDGIRERIPVGFNEHNSIHSSVKEYSGWKEFGGLTSAVKDFQSKAKHQMGTLGGGNHFIELSVDKDDRVWIMLHSGSRYIGNAIAKAHIDIARNLEHNKSGLPDKSLAYFVRNTNEYINYINDLNWSQHYAAANRRRMMTLIQGWLNHLYPSIEYDEWVACHHNYAEVTTHYYPNYSSWSENLIITRKGAISANKNQRGIIPGAMGAKSYIVEGLGCVESYSSAPHGAGRTMSRSKAKKKYRIQDLKETMKNIVCSIDKHTVDEIQYAYKNIDKVMKYSSDLVEPVFELEQIMNIKG